MVLAAERLAAYERDGFVLAKELVPREELVALLAGIDGLLCAVHGDLRTSGPRTIHADIHEKILRVKAKDRALLGRVYDAMRKLLPFWRIVSGPEVTGAVAQLMRSAAVGVGFRGCGIRLDLPDEDEWRSGWHQEYHSQMSSLHGVTAWFNLVPVTDDMGPVQFLRGSHADGLQPVRCLDPLNQGKNYTQTFTLADEAALVARYPIVSTETGLGDFVFLDFLTVHQSGWNRSAGRSRITCQARYFDMADPDAVANRWVGGWQDGGDFTRVHPDKVRS